MRLPHRGAAALAALALLAAAERPAKKSQAKPVRAAKVAGGGFAFDMNVACSSATFGIKTAADFIGGGSVKAVIGDGRRGLPTRGAA